MAEPSNEAEVHFDLGFAYAEMGLADDALSELELGLRLDPHYPHAAEARAVVARLHGDRGNPPDSELH